MCGDILVVCVCSLLPRPSCVRVEMNRRDPYSVYFHLFRTPSKHISSYFSRDQDFSMIL